MVDKDSYTPAEYCIDRCSSGASHVSERASIDNMIGLRETSREVGEIRCRLEFTPRGPFLDCEPFEFRAFVEGSPLLMGRDLSRNELAEIIFKLAILLVIPSAFYAVFFSARYWYDQAQLSLEAPVPPIACASNANQERLKGTEFEDRCDYPGFRSFWGDDAIGQFFRTIFAIAFRFLSRCFSHGSQQQLCRTGIS
jgi:hypothetical protein